MSITFSPSPLAPLMELLANRLSPQAGKSLVIPEGEGNTNPLPLGEGAEGG